MTKFFRLLPGVACVMLTGPAWAGFDFVTQDAQSTAPVAAVEQAVLPPPPGVGGPEIAAPVAAMPAPMPKPVPVASGAPLSIAEPDDMAAGSAYTQPAVTASAPVVNTAPIAVYADRPSARIQVSQSVYPPVGNGAAHPLTGARTVQIAPKPVAARVVPPRMDPAPVAVPVPAPVAVAPKPIQPSLVSAAPVVAPTPVAPAPSAPLAVLDGFGTNIPLSLAMEQVIPTGFTVDDQVHINQDTIVSWVGGRPWDKVLEDMVYAHGARVRVNGKTVTLSAPSAPAQRVATSPTAPLEVVGIPVTAPVSVAPAPVAPAPLPTRDVEDLAAVPAMPPGVGPAPARVSAPVVASTPSPVADSVAPAAAGAYDPSRVDIFSARTGENVKDVLVRWGRIAHIQVIWQMDTDLTLPRSFAVNAPFPRALERFFELYRGGPSVPSAVVTAGPDATVVIRPVQSTPGFRID